MNIRQKAVTVIVEIRIFLLLSVGYPVVMDGKAPAGGKNEPENDSVENRFYTQFFELAAAEVCSDQEQRGYHEIFGNFFHK